MLSSIITGVYKVGDVAIENILKSYIVVNPNNSKIINAWSDPPYSAELKIYRISQKKRKFWSKIKKNWTEILGNLETENCVQNSQFGQK